MARLFNVNLETGDLSQYDSTVTDGGDLSASMSAAIVGNYGQSHVIDDTTAIYGEVNFTSISTTKYYARFYIDPNGLTMSSGNAFDPLNIVRGSATRAAVRMRFSGGNYQLAGRIINDSASSQTSSFTSISDGVHEVELLIEYASSAVANDGKLTLWIDGSEAATVTSVDLFDLSKPDGARFGASIGLDSGTSGTFYLDEFVMDDANQIGSAIIESESVSLSESVSVSIEAPPAGNNVNVSDSVSLSETAVISVDLDIVTSDNVAINDVPQFDTKTISVSDSVSVTDTPVFGNTFYVDSTATDDTGDGSFGDPWKYINTHVNSLSAGDTMFLRGGATAASRQSYVGTNIIAPTVSGTSAAPIMIKNYPGEFVTITTPTTGNDIFDFAHGTSYWTIDGEDTNYHIFVDRNDEGNYAFDIHGSNIVLSNLEIKNGGFDSLIRLHGSTDIEILNSKIHLGFKANNADSHGVNMIDASDGLLISGCIIGDFAGDGLQVGGDGAATADELNVIVEDTDFYIGVLLSAACGENAIDCKNSKDMIVRRCTFHGYRFCDGSCGGTSSGGMAITVHVESDGFDLYDSVFYDCSGGAVRMRRPNIRVWGCLAYGMVAEAAANERMWEFTGGNTFQFWNNTTIGKFGATNGDLFYFTSSPTITIKNNIFDDTSPNIGGDSTESVTADYNAWGSGATQIYSGANDVVEADLDFVNEGADNYRLTSDSPCIDVADTQTPYTDGYFGPAPDMGAFEWVPVDNISVSDSPLLNLVHLISVSETISIAETIARQLLSFVVKTETITLVDSPEVDSGQIDISVSDTVSIGETVKLEPVSSVNVSEAINLSETVQFEVISSISVTDNISLVETKKLEVINLLTVSDSVALSEVVESLLTFLVNISDNISLAETSQLEVTGFISALENINVSETVKAEIASLINVSDNVSISEVTDQEIDTSINVSESVAVGEAVNANIPLAGVLTVNVSSDVNLGESISLETDDLVISIVESVTLGENTQSEIVSFVSVSDSISISETVTLEIINLVSVSDGVAIAETVGLNILSGIAISDAITINDLPDVDNIIDTAVSETINLAESVVVDSLNLISASDLISVAEAVNAEVGINVIASDSVTVVGTPIVDSGGGLSINVSDTVNIVDSPSVVLLAVLVSLNRLYNVPLEDRIYNAPNKDRVYDAN